MHHSCALSIAGVDCTMFQGNLTFIRSSNRFSLHQWVKAMWFNGFCEYMKIISCSNASNGICYASLWIKINIFYYCTLNCRMNWERSASWDKLVWRLLEGKSVALRPHVEDWCGSLIESREGQCISRGWGGVPRLSTAFQVSAWVASEPWDHIWEMLMWQLLWSRKGQRNQSRLGRRSKTEGCLARVCLRR